MKILSTLGLALALTTGPAILTATPASAQPMASYTSCKQLRAEYSGGIAKTSKAAKRVVKSGYRSPIVCPRVYRQVAARLDPNRNGVACESR